MERSLPTADNPLVSFVIPAYNEADFLTPTVEAIRASAGSVGIEYEIVVADDASTDGTGALAESLGARVVSCDNRQIAGTRNAGTRASRGRYLIFVDADTTVNAEVVGAAVSALDKGAVGGGSQVEWDAPVPFQWRLFVWFLMKTFRIAKLAAGSFVFCTREAFDATGGFDERVYATEEIWFSQALKKHGRFVVLKQGVLTSSRKIEDHSSWTVFKTLFSIVLKGPRGVRKRKGHELWYDQRT